MKQLHIILAIFLFSLNCPIIAQINFELTKFPQNNQLIPRNPLTNLGTYILSGSLAAGNNISRLETKIWRDSALHQRLSWAVPNEGKFAFNIPITIKAELKNYKIELVAIKNGAEISLAKAENVVAGDVFIINGQSNCIGHAEISDLDKFMRSYTNAFGWNEINYTAPSKWGARMAKQIIEKEGIPVAIFCEAAGGMLQKWYMRQPLNPYTSGNYGVLHSRLKKAEVEKNIRALLWWQGESDGWETPIDSFKNQFKQLHKQWKEDYNAPVFYFQIRFKACTHINPGIFEAQRQLADEIPNIEILSNNPALSHDGCHFTYINGYDGLGNQAYRLLAAKLYNRSTVNVRPPNILEAFFSASNEITLKLKNISGSLQTIGNPWADFRLEGCKAQITGGWVSDYSIKLLFSGDTSGLTGISYLSRIDAYSQNWVVNTSGVGMLLFYNKPIHKRQLTDTTRLDTEGGAFVVSPTLVSDILNIRFLLKNTIKYVEVVNSYGQIVLTKQIEIYTDSIEFDVTELPSGVYFVVLHQDKLKKARKFVRL